MKAKDLKKKSISIEDVYKRIQQANDNGDFKIFIPHFHNVSKEVTIQLFDDGFKTYKGQWDGVITECLIIEW